MAGPKPMRTEFGIRQRLESCGKQRTRRVEGPWRALCRLKKPFKGSRLRLGSYWVERKRTVHHVFHELLKIIHKMIFLLIYQSVFFRFALLFVYVAALVSALVLFIVGRVQTFRRRGRRSSENLGSWKRRSSSSSSSPRYAQIKSISAP